jgi:hypothetical protein
MMWWKKHKWKIIVPVLVAAILAGSFWYGGGGPNMHGWSIGKQDTSVSQSTDETLKTPESAEAETESADAQENNPETDSESTADSSSSNSQAQAGEQQGNLSADEKVFKAASAAGGSTSASQKGSKSYSQSQGMTFDSKTGKDIYKTDPVPEGKPIPVEPEDSSVTNQALTCTLSVRCDAVLSHLDTLDDAKAELIPEDGVIFPATQVTFYEGESVFNVLQREMKKAKIHMEFENTPIYNSAYIEGIQNLYEFDCGDLSGWMYKVNDWFPNYGCSRYQLKDGDVIEWVYTCDLGVDVGGFYSAAS